MSYNEVFDLHLTPLYAGKKLSGQLYNSNNTTNGSVITSGFVELSNGDYTLNTSIPDQFQGWINIYVSGVGYVADTSVNNGLPVNNGFWSGVAVPAVTWSNLDVPVSTRLATSGYTAPTNIVNVTQWSGVAVPAYVSPTGAAVNVTQWSGVPVPPYISPTGASVNVTQWSGVSVPPLTTIATVANQTSLATQISGVPTVAQNQSGIATLSNQNILLAGVTLTTPTVEIIANAVIEEII
jgi:hypothetical protein